MCLHIRLCTHKHKYACKVFGQHIDIKYKGVHLWFIAFFILLRGQLFALGRTFGSCVTCSSPSAASRSSTLLPVGQAEEPYLEVWVTSHWGFHFGSFLKMRHFNSHWTSFKKPKAKLLCVICESIVLCYWMCSSYHISKHWRRCIEWVCTYSGQRILWFKGGLKPEKQDTTGLFLSLSLSLSKYEENKGWFSIPESSSKPRWEFTAASIDPWRKKQLAAFLCVSFPPKVKEIN